MDKIMITGAAGFVAHHFIQYLYNQDPGTELMCVDISEPKYDIKQYENRLIIEYRFISLMDFNALKKAIEDFQPAFVLHLASFSSVAYSWKHPRECFANNTNIFLNLLEAVSKCKKECRVLSIGSSEEYGNVTKEEIPINENQKLIPTNPYSVARVSQELISKLYVENYGLDIVMTRSFNHIGPWQDERFVVPSFINRIIDIKDSGCIEGVIETGDISVIRDFVDVRDVVRAYYMLLKDGHSGEIYNVCSGKGTSLIELIEIISCQIGVKVSTVVNPEYVRPNDNKIIIGDNLKIFKSIGWRPEYTLGETIKDSIIDVSYQRRIHCGK